MSVAVPSDPRPGLLDQFARFVLTGGLATAMHYAILVVLVQSGACSAVVASTIGFAASAVFNYLVNARFTFRSDRSHRDAAPRFAAVAAAGLGLNALLMWTLAERLGVPYLIAQVVATGVVLVWNFLLNRFWTFSRGPACDTPRPGV